MGVGGRGWGGGAQSKGRAFCRVKLEERQNQRGGRIRKIPPEPVELGGLILILISFLFFFFTGVKKKNLLSFLGLNDDGGSSFI